MWQAHCGVTAATSKSAALRGGLLSFRRSPSATPKRVAAAAQFKSPYRQKKSVHLCRSSFGQTLETYQSRGVAAVAAVGTPGKGDSWGEEQGAWGRLIAFSVAGSALAWCLASTSNPVSANSTVSCSASGGESQTAKEGQGAIAPPASGGSTATAEESAAASRTSQRNSKAVALSLSSEYNANGPIEDRHDVRESPRGDFFASVYDGHGGWQCAEFARKRLNIAAQTELNNSLAKSPEQVKGALTHAFLRVEREYLYQVKAAFELGFGDVARTGACALMALVRDDKLYVANAGDCRAVLGRRRRPWGGEGVMEAVNLSNDHNAREKVEQEKLRRLHPSEEDIVKCRRSNACYVKGRLQPTRSLGDAYLKYSEFNGQAGMHKSGGRFLPPPYTPPYITAEPEIYVHNIDPAQDEFVVIASDGLWDYVTSVEAVEIVQTAAYQDATPAAAGDRLIEVVLQRAAARYNLSVEGLKDVREGPNRRCKHDDITCVVFFLEGNEKNEGFGVPGAAMADGIGMKATEGVHLSQ